MNKIVLNYIQEELGTEPKPLWTEIDEKAFEHAISDIDLRQFPNLNYEEFKDLAFEQLYQTAETEILESAFDLVDGMVQSFEQGGVLPYSDGGSITKGNSTPKSKTLSGEQMMQLIMQQSTGNQRKDKKGLGAIANMIQDNPNIQFTVFEDGRIDVSGTQGWNEGAGTGRNFANRPSLLDRISRGGENKAQRLYQELANSIASGKQSELFKEEPKKEEDKKKVESKPVDVSDTDPDKFKAELDAKVKANEDEDARAAALAEEAAKKKQGGGSGKGKVSGGKNLARLTAANKAYTEMSDADKEEVKKLALSKKQSDPNMYWINAVEEYLANKSKGGDQSEEEPVTTSQPTAEQLFEANPNSAGAMGVLYGTPQSNKSGSNTASVLGDIAQGAATATGLTAAMAGLGKLGSYAWDNRNNLLKLINIRRAGKAHQAANNQPRLLLGEGKKPTTQSGTSSVAPIKEESVIVTPEPKKQEVLLLPEGRKQLPGYGEPATRKQNQIEGEYSPQTESKKSDNNSKLKGLTFKQFLKNEGLVETDNPARPYRTKSGKVAYTKDQVMSKFEAAKNLKPKAKYGMLIPKPKVQFLQLGGVLKATAKSTPFKGVVDSAIKKYEGLHPAVKAGIGAGAEAGTDYGIGYGQGMMDSRQVEENATNTVLDLASMLPGIGMPAQLASSVYRIYQEYQNGSLDYKDFVSELTDIVLSIGGVKFLKSIPKLISLLSKAGKATNLVKKASTTAKILK